MEVREDHAWLLKSRINPLPISGSLALRDGRLTFTLDAAAAEAPLEWLEKHLDATGLRQRIEAGETIVAFDEPLAEADVTWPLTGGGAMMMVKAGDRKWVVSYDFHSGRALSQTVNLMSGRKKAKEWKKAIAEAEKAAAA